MNNTMITKRVPRLMIAGTGSGSGKTTITCAVLYGLKKQGYRLSARKCGPDYIDPSFHGRVLGVSTGNLDSFFTDDNTLKSLLASDSGDLCVIEGVMGYFDGMGFSQEGSSCHIAAITNTPVVLVVNVSGMSVSALAIVKGFLDYEKEKNIKGVIFNQLPAMLYQALKEETEKLGIKVLGYVPTINECSFESRNLGLVTAKEVDGFHEKLDYFYEQIKDTIDWNGLVSLASSAAPVLYKQEEIKPEGKHIKIAVAKDEAFCFLYQDNIELLQKLGCDIMYFSPLSDKHLPEGADGLILSGGYPELAAKKLEDNKSMRTSIKEAIDAGLPVIAECGGFMYLHDTLKDAFGNVYEMAGVIPGKTYSTKKLQRFGYFVMEAKEDSMICEAGDEITAHEFHYYDSTYNGDGFVTTKTGNHCKWEAGVVTKSMYAGFPHLYLYGNIKAATRFVKAAKEYGKK